MPVYILTAVDAYQKGTDTGKNVMIIIIMLMRTYVLCKVQVKCLWDEVKSYEVVLLGFFIIIIL